MPIAGPRPPKPKPASGKKYHDAWWSHCICCARIPKEDGNKSANSIPVTDVEGPAENSAEPPQRRPHRCQRRLIVEEEPRTEENSCLIYVSVFTAAVLGFL